MVATGSWHSISGDLCRRVLFVIRADPRQSGRAVEALRIALGLGTGDNPLTVILLDNAPLLLAEDTDDVVDVEILEKHLPVFKEFKMPFVLQHNSRTRFSLDSEFEIGETSDTEITASIAAADRVLAF